MDTTAVILHRTAAGQQACERANCRLPHDYRAILHAVEGLTCFETVRQALPGCPPRDIVSRIEDLEAIGLIETVSLDWLAELYSTGDYA